MLRPTIGQKDLKKPGMSLKEEAQIKGLIEFVRILQVTVDNHKESKLNEYIKCSNATTSRTSG